MSFMCPIVQMDSAVELDYIVVNSVCNRCLQTPAKTLCQMYFPFLVIL